MSVEDLQKLPMDQQALFVTQAAQSRGSTGGVKYVQNLRQAYSLRIGVPWKDMTSAQRAAGYLRSQIPNLLKARAAQVICQRDKLQDILQTLHALAGVHSHAMMLLCPSLCKGGQNWNIVQEKLRQDMITVGDMDGAAIQYAANELGAVRIRV
jgi:hypothetical protein